jgi:ABC-type transport system substrate-binding protein
MTFFSFLFKKKFPGADARSQITAGPLTPFKLLSVALLIALAVVVYAFIVNLNNSILVTVPARGGTLVEGIVGAPRVIDPLSAVTDADIAMTKLAYPGLMKELADGSVTLDLARDYSVSPDGHTYTFVLLDKLKFSDGSVLTAADVAATIEALQNPALNPRSYSYWQTIAVSTPDTLTVQTILLAPDDEFLKRMTIGIMSAVRLHTENRNELSPLGAGPFRLTNIEYDESGAPERFHFERNPHYALIKPFLSDLDVMVYANQETLLSALSRGDIDLTFALVPETLTPETTPSNATFIAIPTDRRVALWQLSRSELTSESLRATLNRFVDKSSIVATIENGYGILPVGNSQSLTLEEAQLALEKSGYSVSNGVLSRNKTPVSLSIATVNDPKLLKTAQMLTQSFTALGAITPVLGFDRGTLNDELGKQNLPLILSDDTFTVPPAYSEAIPLYTSAIVLAADSGTHGVAVEHMTSPILRYANVSGWYARTDKVWPFLNRIR